MGELLGVVAAVKADGHAALGGLLPALQHHLGKGLGGMADDVDVHAVQPHAHGAPQAGGAKFQGGEEAALDLLFVAADGLQLRLLGGVQSGGSEPLFIGITIGHNKTSHFKSDMEIIPQGKEKLQ